LVELGLEPVKREPPKLAWWKRPLFWSDPPEPHYTVDLSPLYEEQHG
jgi:hypothetical protein